MTNSTLNLNVLMNICKIFHQTNTSKRVNKMTIHLKYSKHICDALRAIWYHLHNLKNMKNTHGGVLLLLKVATVTKECYSC